MAETESELLNVVDENLILALQQGVEHSAMEENLGIRLVATTQEEVEDPAPEPVKPAVHTSAWQDTPPMGKTKFEAVGNAVTAKQVAIEVSVLTLSEASDLKSYNELLMQNEDPLNNVFLEEKQQWSDMSDTWKVFAKVRKFKFKH